MTHPCAGHMATCDHCYTCDVLGVCCACAPSAAASVASAAAARRELLADLREAQQVDRGCVDQLLAAMQADLLQAAPPAVLPAPMDRPTTQVPSVARTRANTNPSTEPAPLLALPTTTDDITNITTWRIIHDET